MPNNRIQMPMCTLLSLFLATIFMSTGCEHTVERKIEPKSQRTAPAGSFRGVDMGHGTYGYLGIPYARPPVGALRWRAPQALAPLAQPFDAKTYGSPCVQPVQPIGGLPGDDGEVVGQEDCLTLNIHIQQPTTKESEAPEQLRPVMVWIHGGANRVGASKLYDGTNLAAAFGVIVVTVNYRLGVLGWLRHPGLVTGDPLDDSGNFGTLDLIAALGWIRGNIRSFGGDPARVTLFGESAGGRNVLSLLGSPLARGLFHGAIAQSGSTETTPLTGARTHIGEQMIINGQTLSEALMARNKIKAHTHSEQGRLLRNADAKTLVEIGGGAFAPQHTLFADGTVLSDQPLLTCFSDARCRHDVPLMVGTTRDEMTTFMAFNPYWVSLLGGLPSRIHHPKDYAQHARWASMYWKLRGADRIARAFNQSGGKVWMYRWDWDEEPIIFGVNLAQIFGAAHGFEIPFVFNDFSHQGMKRLFTRENGMGRMILAREMGGYWTSFAALGSPRGQQPWMRWSFDKPGMLLFDTLAGGGLQMKASNLTLESILAELKKSPHYRNQKARCQELVQVIGGYDDFSEGQWTRFGCDAFDPWELYTAKRVATVAR